MDALERPGVAPIDRFRARLRNGSLCIGSAITFTDPLVTAAIGTSADFFWIDLEHASMSPEALQGHLLAARAAQVPALVRVTGSTTPFIKPVLDAGADGIVVPQIRSADEVRSIVADCRYPPLGRRGYGPRVPANFGRDEGADYVARANRQVFVSVQIETVEAVAAIEEIVAVSGLDSIVLGPWDLSMSMGLPGEVEHPAMVEAIDVVIRTAHAAGLAVGTGMGTDPEYAVRMARRGVQWVQLGADFGYMIRSVDELSERIRRDLSAPADSR